MATVRTRGGKGVPSQALSIGRRFARCCVRRGRLRRHRPRGPRVRGNPRFFRYVKAAPVDAFPAPVNATLIPTSLEIRPVGQNTNLPLTEAPLPTQPLVPNVLVRVTNSAKPAPDQLSSALLKSFRDSEPALQTGDVFR